MILFDGQKALAAQRQYVAGQRIALGIVDLDEFESACLQQFDRLDGKPWEVDERGLLMSRLISDIR